MHESHASQEAPPSGGIFLSSRLDVPDFIESLAQRLPELQQSSQMALEQLDRLFGEPAASDSVNRQYIDYVEKFVRKVAPLAAEISFVGYVEHLKEEANRFEDAWSAVCQHGWSLASYLSKNLPPGQHRIGNHQYELAIDSSDRRWLRGFDETTSELVYFNRLEGIAEPLSRTSFLADYARLMGDVTLERASLPAELLAQQIAADTPPFDWEAARAKRAEHEARRQANGALAYAYCFWLTHNDLLPEDMGQVIDINQTIEGELTTEEIGQGTRLILYFDARHRRENVYVWRLKSIDVQTHTQIMEECTVGHEQLDCQQYLYNFQYRPQISPSEPGPVLERVIEIAEHDATKKQILKLRQELENRRETVGKWALQAACDPQHKPYGQSDSPHYTSALRDQKHYLYKATFLNESGRSGSV